MMASWRNDTQMGTILQPVKNRSLSDDVADAVRDAIFSGQYPPGSPLREMHLAKELGVSQKTVRDALSQARALRPRRACAEH